MFTEQLDTVVLLLVELIGSVVISLTRYCLPINDEGPGPPNIFFLEPPLHISATGRPIHFMFGSRPGFSGSADRYGHSKLSKMVAADILNLFESKIAPLDPPSQKTPL